MEVTINVASFCLDLFIPFLITGITKDEVIPRSVTTKINSKKVKPSSFLWLINLYKKSLTLKINLTIN